MQDGAEAEHGHQGIEGTPVCLAAPTPGGPLVVLLPRTSSTPSHRLTPGRVHSLNTCCKESNQVGVMRLPACRALASSASFHGVVHVSLLYLIVLSLLHTLLFHLSTPARSSQSLVIWYKANACMGWFAGGRAHGEVQLLHCAHLQLHCQQDAEQRD